MNVTNDLYPRNSYSHRGKILNISENFFINLSIFTEILLSIEGKMFSIEKVLL